MGERLGGRTRLGRPHDLQRFERLWQSGLFVGAVYRRNLDFLFVIAPHTGSFVTGHAGDGSFRSGCVDEVTGLAVPVCLRQAIGRGSDRAPVTPTAVGHELSRLIVRVVTESAVRRSVDLLDGDSRLARIALRIGSGGCCGRVECEAVTLGASDLGFLLGIEQWHVAVALHAGNFLACAVERRTVAVHAPLVSRIDGVSGVSRRDHQVPPQSFVFPMALDTGALDGPAVVRHLNL